MFLHPDEVSQLTGRKLKRLQIEQLRKMGIPFWVNAAGAPIVCRSALEGGSKAAQDIQPDHWTPKPLRRAA